MTTPTEALKLAIDTQDAIRNFVGIHGQENTATFLLLEADRALSAVRVALAQPQPSAPAFTGGSPEHMLQDMDRGLSRWLSEKPDARMHAREAAAAIAQPSAASVEPHPLTLLQAGFNNAELLAQWRKKLPGVEPTDHELSAFAVGTEVGWERARDIDRQDWSRVHHALAKHGKHPGRTDDHLADVIDRALSGTAPTAPAPLPADTLCQQLQQQCNDWGLYWRASDAHGVDCTVQQAAELLAEALGVEVNIERPSVGTAADLREKLIDAIVEGLGGALFCNRVWSAWDVGTMTEDDFSPVAESDTPAELADAVLSIIGAAPLMANGLTEAETAATASVAGLADWAITPKPDGTIIVMNPCIGGYAAHPDHESIASSVLASFAADVLAARASAPAVAAPEPASQRERWNIERDGDGLLVCFNNHDKAAACEYVRYVPQPSAAPLPAREPLMDDDILKCVRSIGLPRLIGLVLDRGPYEVTKPTYYLQLLVRAIEAAHGIAAAPAAQSSTKESGHDPK